MSADRSIFEIPQEPIDPVAMARRDLKKSLPKRFWKDVACVAEENGFAIHLDGKPTRTPARASLVMPHRALAEIVAEEWREVGEFIDPAEMPITRIVNTAIDAVSKRMTEVADDCARYAASDLLCYRAEEPQRLVERQSLHWDPVLAWAKDSHGWRFALAGGVVHIDQPEETCAAVRAHLHAVSDSLRLSALHVVTTMTGSVLLALSLAEGAFGPTAIWNAAHVDEDVQMEIWGQDAEALEKRAHREREFRAAATILAGF